MALGFAALEPVKSHIHLLCFLGDNVLIVKSICCGVACLDGGVRLWPFNFFEIFSQSGTIALSVMKSQAISSSEAEGMNTLIIFSRDRTWPLLQGIGSLYEHKMCDPAWLRVQVSLRYAASEFAANIILMDLYVMPSLG